MAPVPDAEVLLLAAPTRQIFDIVKTLAGAPVPSLAEFFVFARQMPCFSRGIPRRILSADGIAIANFPYVASDLRAGVR